MAEVEVPAEAYAVQMACDTCKTGFMLPNGDVAWLSSPPQFPHKCNNPECNAVGGYTERYPAVRFRVGVRC